MTTQPGDIDRYGHTLRIGALDQFYLDVPGGSPTLLMLHGLSSNANVFGALMAAGLSPTFHIVAPDLRGRARSGQPPTGYAMADHATDMIGLLDVLALSRVAIVGHSFGGWLGIYLAANFAERVERLVLIDVALSYNATVAALLKPGLDRLRRVLPSADAYVAEVRGAPHLDGVWDEHMERSTRAELRIDTEGTVRARTSATAVTQALAALTSEPWLHMVQQVRQPTLLLNAVRPYGPPGSPPLVEEINARATARAFANARYVQVPGNHMTMILGAQAPVLAGEIASFLRSS